jgi:hypothetical protein
MWSQSSSVASPVVPGCEAISPMPRSALSLFLPREKGAGQVERASDASSVTPAPPSVPRTAGLRRRFLSANRVPREVMANTGFSVTAVRSDGGGPRSGHFQCIQPRCRRCFVVFRFAPLGNGSPRTSS